MPTIRIVHLPGETTFYVEGGPDEDGYVTCVNTDESGVDAAAAVARRVAAALGADVVDEAEPDEMTLTVVTETPDWTVAEENFPRLDEGEGDATEYVATHTPCAGEMRRHHRTGRAFCNCGFWYERALWDISGE